MHLFSVHVAESVVAAVPIAVSGRWRILGHSRAKVGVLGPSERVHVCKVYDVDLRSRGQYAGQTVAEISGTLAVQNCTAIAAFGRNRI